MCGDGGGEEAFGGDGVVGQRGGDRRSDAGQRAFADALARADLVISTGGLGPTPDDLTREALAAVSGETNPRVLVSSWSSVPTLSAAFT